MVEQGVLGPLWAIVLLALGIMAVSSWYLYPSSVTEVEKEAYEATKKLGQKALDVEHRVEDWLHPQQQGRQQNAGTTNDNNSNPNRRSSLTSEEATARMLAQSSTWVDGEKKLKAKLKELAERQKQGKDLGVPVLTRYLGEDIPAWVGEGVNEAEWRKQVDAKYEEMRKEEEEWKRRMQAIIDQRERDIGITTAR